MKELESIARDTGIALGHCGALSLALIAIIRSLPPDVTAQAALHLHALGEALTASSLATPSQSDALVQTQADMVEVLLREMRAPSRL